MSLALRLTQNRANAEDLVQDTFVKMHRFRDGYNPKLSLKNWMLTIMTRAHLDNLRRKIVVESLDVPIPGTDGVYYDPPDMAASAEEQITARIGYLELVQAIQDVVPGISEALILSEAHDMSYEEVSKQLRINVGTVRSRVYRTKRKLQNSAEFRERLELAGIAA